MLRSLKAQSVPLEIAVLNASGDPRVIDALEGSNLSIDYYREGPDDGQAAAIAEGWKHTGGDIIGWLNADDILFPNALEHVHQAFGNADAPDCVYGDSIIIDENGAVLGLHGQVGDVDDTLGISNCISQPSCFVRRAAVDHVGGLDEALTYTMDWELWTRLQQAGKRFHRIDRYLSAVYWGANTKTASLSFRRLKELVGHTLRYAGPASALRTLTGIMTQAAPEGSRLRRWAGRHLSDTERSGILASADRNPRETGQPALTLPLINVFNRPLNAYRVTVSGNTAHIEPPIGGTITQLSPHEWRIALAEPVMPAQVAEVTIEGTGNMVRLERVEWDTNQPEADMCSPQEKVNGEQVG